MTTDSSTPHPIADRIAAAREHRHKLDAQIRAYDGGDRPSSPPSRLLRDYARADKMVRALEAEQRAEKCARCSNPAGETAVRDGVDTLCMACSIDDLDGRDIDGESGGQ